VNGATVSRSDDQGEPDVTGQAFGAELTYWREVRGLSKRALAQSMGFDPSYISHIESGRHHPSEDFARRAEEVLSAGKAIWRCFQDDETARHRTGAANRIAPVMPEPSPAGPALLVEHDHAQLVYTGGIHHLTMRRRLANTGSQPVSRYLVRISVDRYPGDPERSNALYRADPLTWDELNLHADCNGEAMTYTIKHDRDAFKEVWLAFANADNRFPLYPGERTWIEYSYSVSDAKWGRWFQRAVRLPTQHLSVQLIFPTTLTPIVWGTETSMTAEASPFRTAITRTDGPDGRSTFDWACEQPQLDARYKLEWRFRTPPTTQPEQAR
jgi:transcriptional regulator with XRE-family HTH domain